MKLALVLIVAISSTVLACPDDDHEHTHVRRADTSSPITPPTRPLVWGDLNVIHTTDTHGWLLGHQKSSAPEPNYRYRTSCFSCRCRSYEHHDPQRNIWRLRVVCDTHETDCTRETWPCSFCSFRSSSKERTQQEKNVDLLLVDSGDVHDGTGLSDGFPAGGIDAHAVILTII